MVQTCTYKGTQKGEIDVRTGALVCDIKFATLSLEERQVDNLELTPFGEALTYPYIYPYYYGGLNNNIAVVIDNTGNLLHTARSR